MALFGTTSGTDSSSTFASVSFPLRVVTPMVVNSLTFYALDAGTYRLSVDGAQVGSDLVVGAGALATFPMTLAVSAATHTVLITAVSPSTARFRYFISPGGVSETQYAGSGLEFYQGDWISGGYKVSIEWDAALAPIASGLTATATADAPTGAVSGTNGTRFGDTSGTDSTTYFASVSYPLRVVNAMLLNSLSYWALDAGTYRLLIDGVQVGPDLTVGADSLMAFPVSQSLSAATHTITVQSVSPSTTRVRFFISPGGASETTYSGSGFEFYQGDWAAVGSGYKITTAYDVSLSTIVSGIAATASGAAPAGSVLVDGVGGSVAAATAAAPAGTASGAPVAQVTGLVATASAVAVAGATAVPAYVDIDLPASVAMAADLSLSVEITPTGTVDSLFTQVNVVMPLPDLDSNGMVDPDVFVPTSVTRTDWGRIQVVLGGRDVTVLRGVPTEVVSYSNGEPFGDMTCVLRFPGITPFEGAGALSLTGLTMFAGNPDVTLRRIHPDGSIDPSEQALWQGLLASDDDSVDDGSFSGLTVQCMGALYQASLQVHQPAFDLNARDIGTVIPQVLNSALGRRYATTANVATGIMTRKRGSWGPKLDFVQELLSEAVTEDGEQWTIRLLKGRKPVLVLKDMDTFHHTMTTGTQGLRINMQRDRTQATNVVYGEGVAQDQCRWRNTRYPANGRAFFQPLAENAATQPYLYDEDGNITGPNPIFDTKVIRVERWEQFGEGIQPGQGVTSAQGEISRANTVDFSGTLTLAIDPEEGSRFAMRAGENLVLKQYRGANRVLHIGKVDVNVQSQTVTLTVDSQARDLATLAQVRLRNREATDPARALVGRRTQSRTQQDTRAVWDCENGAGTIPSTELAVGWNVIKVPAGQAGSIVRTFMSTSPARRFSVAVFGRPVTPSLMYRLAPNPLTAFSGGSIYDANAVVLDGAGLLIAFGGPDNACGYYPNTDPASGAPGLHDLTGDLLDDGGWEYSSLYPPTIWVAVFVTATCTITGRLYQSVNGG